MSKTTIPTGGITADAINATLIADDAISEEHLDPTAITASTEKSTLVAADKFLIADSAASNAIKFVQQSNLGSDNHVLLGSTNVTSNVSNVTFQSLFSNTYTNYFLTGRGITKPESSHVQLRFLNGGTTDSGSNYDDVYGIGMRSRSATNWTGRHSNATALQFIESAHGNTATFSMWIDTSFRATSNYVNVHGIESHWISDGHVTATFGGVYFANTNVDGITFVTTSGGFNSGRFSLYGVKHA